MKYHATQLRLLTEDLALARKTRDKLRGKPHLLAMYTQRVKSLKAQLADISEALYEAQS